MDHADHVRLLKPANMPTSGTWADLGAGSGAFTLALRDVIGPDATLYAVDKNRSALNQLDAAHRQRFGSSRNLILLHEDFSRLNIVPPLDGVVMANSLHFFKDKEKILRHVNGLLKPNGMLLIVEYNVDSGNMWVPHPLSFETYRTLAPRAGFSEPRLLAKVPSSFLREFYSASAYKLTPDSIP
jgi:ubiquinone/menaquinone biosynthesis C-methylase UbiE